MADEYINVKNVNKSSKSLRSAKIVNTSSVIDEPKTISVLPRYNSYTRFNFGLSLVLKIILICLTIGFIWYMNARPFDFHTLVEGATTQNFIQGWDYQESIQEINTAFDKIRLDDSNLPDWLTNLFNGVVEFILGFRYLCIATVSLAYVVGWLLGFAWYMLGAL